MERLTKKIDIGYILKLPEDKNISDLEIKFSVYDKLGRYEDLQEMIGIPFEEFAELCKQEIPEECKNPSKAIILTDDDVDKWHQYKAIGTVEDIQKVLSFLGDENKRSIIDDLKLLNQYKEIGTVEGCKRAIEISKENYYLYLEYKAKVQEYEAIGTVEEFKALKEKNEPKKPLPIDYENYIGIIANAKFLKGAYWCPNCKHTVRSGVYCDDCGQALDWE